MEGKKLLLFGGILGLSLVLSAVVVAQTFLRVKRLDDVISVNGSAKKQVTSDSARWNASFSRTVLTGQIKSGYAQMKTDEQVVRNFLNSQGFTDAEISPVFMNEIYYGKGDGSTERQYNLIQNIQVRSTDVQKMKALAKNSSTLAESGIIFSPGAVQYYYSKLPELRISLLPDAIRDSKARAETIANSSGKKVNSVKSVSMGVVQVMPVGSLDVSDYGTYDTSEIEKEVMITVKTTFSLK